MTLDEYQKFTTSTSLYKTTDGLFLGLCEEAGEVAGKRKKYLRGDYDSYLESHLLPHERTVNPDEYISLLKKELGDVMWYISQICNAHGFTIQEVIEGNVAKLSDRKERGVLQGSGDSR